MSRSLNNRQIEELQKILGYRFNDPGLLSQALTHSSYSREQAQRGSDVPDYERLEFLGDAVLELMTSELLFHRYDWPEGKLTRQRARIVCEESLSYVAKMLGLPGYLILSHGEEKTGGRQRPSILCDIVESVIGAVYLDGGLEEARKLIGRILYDHLDEIPAVYGRDHKTVLQELLQGEGKEPPAYEVIREEGPPHARIFTVSLSIGEEVVSSASGHSKKQAEQNAALEAIGLLYPNHMTGSEHGT